MCHNSKYLPNPTGYIRLGCAAGCGAAGVLWVVIYLVQHFWLYVLYTLPKWRQCHKHVLSVKSPFRTHKIHQSETIIRCVWMCVCVCADPLSNNRSRSFDINHFYSLSLSLSLLFHLCETIANRMSFAHSPHAHAFSYWWSTNSHTQTHTHIQMHRYKTNSLKLHVLFMTLFVSVWVCLE